MTVINACAKWRHGGKTFQKPDGKTLKRDESFCNFLTHFLSAMLISYNKVGCFFFGGGGMGGHTSLLLCISVINFFKCFFFPLPFLSFWLNPELKRGFRKGSRERFIFEVLHRTWRTSHRSGINKQQAQKKTSRFYASNVKLVTLRRTILFVLTDCTMSMQSGFLSIFTTSQCLDKMALLNTRKYRIKC